MPDQLPPIRIRISDNALRELDKIASNNRRSRNAEASALLEAGLVGEELYPEDTALRAFVTATTNKVSALIGSLGMKERGQVLTMLDGALDALLKGLGADGNPAAFTLGEGVGRRTLDEARLASGKAPEKRNAEEELLARATKDWGDFWKKNGGGERA